MFPFPFSSLFHSGKRQQQRVTDGYCGNDLTFLVGVCSRLPHGTLFFSFLQFFARVGGPAGLAQGDGVLDMA